MDPVTVLALVVGINVGLTIGIGTFLLGVFRRQDRDDESEQHAAGDIGVGLAMTTLCSAVNRMNPQWQTIEIIRNGDSAASMTIKSDLSDPDSEPGSKLH